jgi:hypothetical protein
MTTLYASLDQTKDILTATQPTQVSLTVNDRLLLRLLRVVSQRVDNLFPSVPRWSMFAPQIGTRTFLMSAAAINSWANTFTFSADLLSASAISVNGTPFTVGSNITLYPDPSQPPFHAIQLADPLNQWSYYLCGDTRTPMIAITGVWGFHSDYANAWLAVDTLAAAITTTTATTLTTAHISSTPDVYGQVPQISAGNLLLIDSEYLEVVLAPPGSAVVTVRRGVNGSTAATHAQDAPVSVWQVEPSVNQAVARQAALNYSRRGAFTTVEVSGMSEVRFPQDMLNELYATMQAYVYG